MNDKRSGQLGKGQMGEISVEISSNHEEGKRKSAVPLAGRIAGRYIERL